MAHVSDSDRVLALGIPLILADGRTVRVRYGMRSLKLIEDRYGSLAAVQTLIPTDAEGHPTGRAIGPILELLAAGLIHEGISEDELLDLTLPAELETYAETIGKAFEQAFPKAAAARGNPTLAPTNGASRGQISTTPPLSNSGVVTPISGI